MFNTQSQYSIFNLVSDITKTRLVFNMNVQHRIKLLVRLGTYMLSEDEEWILARKKASAANSWFTPEFIDLSVQNIVREFLDEDNLISFVAMYRVPDENPAPKKIGLVMAGNIPLVGFHDWLCIFLTGNIAVVKPSSKDEILFKNLIEKLASWDEEINNLVSFQVLLKDCDAYIATGSNNSGRYFDQYFAKYPHIIRRNRTSVAILTGDESKEELELLSDDIHLFFGLGCRNVTKIYVPKNYDFIPLIASFNKYAQFGDHHKYKNNYDYQLAIQLLNKQYYMTNGATLLIENESPFSPISQLNIEYYESVDGIPEKLGEDGRIQCIVGRNHIPFGAAQSPTLTDYADGVDTMQFLLHLEH